jgi:hypothetical protein
MIDSITLWARSHSVQIRTAVVLVALGGGIVAWIRAAGVDSVVDRAPVVAATVALLSLAVAAASAVATWRRQKREATLKVWAEWSIDSVEARRELSALFGKNNITRDQARSLMVGSPPLMDINGNQLDDVRRREVLHSIVGILNGLERLAVGANLGAFDSATLKALGGTIIVRTFNRLQPYIEERRTTEHEHLRQRTAFVDLQWLVAEIESRNLLARKREVDQERLRRLQAS